MRKFLSIALSASLLCGVSAQSITLKEALDAAYESNPEIMASRARLETIGESYNQADSLNDLTLDLEGSYGASRRKTSTIFSNRTEQAKDIGGELGVSLTKPLYQGGRVKALKKQSQADIEAARQTLRRTQQKVFLETTNAYIDAVFDAEALKLQQEHSSILNDLKRLVTSREEIGIGTETDIWRINSRHSALAGDIARAETKLAVSQTVFRQVTGKNPDNVQWNRSLSVPGSVDAAVDLARNNNPQLFEAISREDSAEAAIDVAKSANKPTVAIVGNSFITDERLTDLHDVDGVTVGLNFRMPLLGKGGNNSRIRAAKHELATRQFETALVQRNIRSGIEQAWVQYNGSKSVRESVKMRMENAKKTYKNIQIEFELGTRTIFDVVESEQDYLNSQVEYFESRRTSEQSAAYLLAAMGMVDTIPHVQQVLPSGPDQIGDKAYAALTQIDSPAELSRGIPIGSKIIQVPTRSKPHVHKQAMVSHAPSAISMPRSNPIVQSAPVLRRHAIPQTMAVPALQKPTMMASRSAPRPIPVMAPIIAKPAPVIVSNAEKFASLNRTDAPSELGRYVRTAPAPIRMIKRTPQYISAPQTKASKLMASHAAPPLIRPVSKAKIFASLSSHDTPAQLGRSIPVAVYQPAVRARPVAAPILRQAARPTKQGNSITFRHVLD